MQCKHMGKAQYLAVLKHQRVEIWHAYFISRDMVFEQGPQNPRDSPAFGNQDTILSILYNCFHFGFAVFCIDCSNGLT